MPKINQEEYEKIKLLPDYDWNWIAREKTGKILSFTNKPTKTDEVWKDKQTQLWFNYKNSQLFQFIQWEDEEPYEIAELIEEYEHSAEHVSHVINDRMGSLVKTWSESMSASVKKDIKWLKDEVNRITNEYASENIFANYTRYMISDIKDAINQLDEPEVLSQEWIDKNKTSIDRKLDGTPIYKVREELLQNLLVPKHGLPVIPKYVADWIEDIKPNKSLRVAFEYIAQRKANNHDDPLAFWIEEGNSETFARAWIDGYKVEEEKLYIVQLPTNLEDDLIILDADGDIWKDSWPSRYKMTEKRIKEIDERFWPFAVEVEEETLYHALIKGHELVSNNVKYWVCDERYKQTVFINFKNPLSDVFINRLTKKKWNELGINDTNADFVKADK